MKTHQTHQICCQASSYGLTGIGSHRPRKLSTDCRRRPVLEFDNFDSCDGRPRLLISDGFFQDCGLPRKIFDAFVDVNLQALDDGVTLWHPPISLQLEVMLRCLAVICFVSQSWVMDDLDHQTGSVMMLRQSCFL